jgi:ketosteroid isomerase-like protein
VRRFKITWFLLGQGAFACTPKAGLASIDKRLVILSEVADREANGYTVEESQPRKHTLRPAREFSQRYQEMDLNDEQLITQLFEDGDRALIARDVAELSRIFADDYVQYDECGKASTRADVITTLSSGKIRYVSMVSTGRRIYLLRDDLAIVHGSEDDEVEQEGKRFPVRYVYMDVVMKRDEKWRIVASQLAKPMQRS